MSRITLEELEIAKNYHYRHIDDTVVQQISTDKYTYLGNINSVGTIINMTKNPYQSIVQSIVTEIFTILQCFSLIDECENWLYIHIGYRSLDKSYYIEYSFNYEFNRYLRKNQIYYKVLDQIHKQLVTRMRQDNANSRYIRPIIQPPTTQISDELTTFTISYWQSFSGFYEYINNLDQMNTFLADYRYYHKDEKEYDNKMNQLSDKVAFLNRAIQSHEFTRPMAFYMYKQYLSDILTVDCEELPVSKIDNACFCIRLD